MRWSTQPEPNEKLREAARRYRGAPVGEPSLVIEPLASHHDRTDFSCGEPALDAYLQRQASQDMRRRIAQVFVAVGDAPGMIAGYYSVSAASFPKG